MIPLLFRLDEGFASAVSTWRGQAFAFCSDASPRIEGLTGGCSGRAAVRYHPAVIKILVRSCLLGAPVRYDAPDKKCEHAILARWIEQGRVVSVCPEMLGG